MNNETYEVAGKEVDKETYEHYQQMIAYELWVMGEIDDEQLEKAFQ